MGKRILSVLLAVVIISGFVFSGRQVRADEVDYANVSLAQLVKMKDDPEELANVHGVSVSEYKSDKKLEESC